MHRTSRNIFKRTAAFAAALTLTFASMGFSAAADEELSLVEEDMSAAQIGEADIFDSNEPGAADDSPADSDIAEGDIPDDSGEGANISSATLINFGTEYSGEVTNDSRHAFFGFTVPKSGRVTITMKSYFDCAYLQLWNEDGVRLWNYQNLRWSSASSMSSYKLDVFLTAGTYYFSTGTYYSSNNANYFGPCNIKADYTEYPESFPENFETHDDDMLTANSISTNKEYSGILGVGDTADFYKFTLKNANTITLNAESTANNARFSIADERGQEVQVFSYSDISSEWNAATGKMVISKKFELPAGTYYLSHKRNTTWSGYHLSAAYSFSLNEDVPKPANIKATGGNGKATLSWDKVSGASKYRVYYYYNNKFYGVGNTTKNSYTVSNLKNGVNYGFTVRAYKNGVWSDYSVSDCVYAETKTPKTNFTTARGNGYINVTWTGVQDASKYRIYTYADGKFTLKKEVDGSTRSYKITGLTNNKTYGVVVRAYANSGWYNYGVSDCKNATTKTPAATFTVTPASKSATVKWNAVSGATKYRVYYYDYSAKKFTLVKEVGKDVRSYKITGLKGNKKYGFVVRAYAHGAWYKYGTADCKDAVTKA